MHSHLNKLHVKLFLIFSLLFSSVTYHQNAQAGVLKTARNIVIAAAIIAGIYYVTKKFGQSESPDDSPGMRNVKKFARKITFAAGNTGEAINSSIKENFGVDPKKGIEKVVNKTVNVIKDTKRCN